MPLKGVTIWANPLMTAARSGGNGEAQCVDAVDHPGPKLLGSPSLGS
jgi:hypothetical protein